MNNPKAITAPASAQYPLRDYINEYGQKTEDEIIISIATRRAYGGTPEEMIWREAARDYVLAERKGGSFVGNG